MTMATQEEFDLGPGFEPRPARPRPAPVPESAPRTGPIPGQTVMHQHDLGRQFSGEHLYHDRYGFVRQPIEQDSRGGLTGDSRLLWFYESHGGRFSRDMHHGIRHYMAGISGERDSDIPWSETRDFMGDLGITRDEVMEHNRKTRHVRRFWNSRPVVDIPADSILHTGQSEEDTAGEPSERPDGSMGMSGDDIIHSLTDDISSGRSLHQEPWVIKDRDRYMVMDGHHSIAGMRAAGRPYLRVRMWDRDR